MSNLYEWDQLNLKHEVVEYLKNRIENDDLSIDEYIKIFNDTTNYIQPGFIERITQTINKELLPHSLKYLFFIGSILLAAILPKPTMGQPGEHPILILFTSFVKYKLDMHHEPACGCNGLSSPLYHV